MFLEQTFRVDATLQFHPRDCFLAIFQHQEAYSERPMRRNLQKTKGQLSCGRVQLGFSRKDNQVVITHRSSLSPTAPSESRKVPIA